MRSKSYEKKKMVKKNFDIWYIDIWRRSYTVCCLKLLWINDLWVFFLQALPSISFMRLTILNKLVGLIYQRHTPLMHPGPLEEWDSLLLTRPQG